MSDGVFTEWPAGGRGRGAAPRRDGLTTGLLVAEEVPANALTGHHLARPRHAQQPAVEPPGPRGMLGGSGEVDLGSTAGSAMLNGTLMPPGAPYMSSYQAQCAGDNEFGVSTKRRGKRSVAPACAAATGGPRVMPSAPLISNIFQQADLQAGTAKGSQILGTSGGHIAGYTGHISSANPSLTAAYGSRNPADKGLFMENYRPMNGPLLGCTKHVSKP